MPDSFFTADHVAYRNSVREFPEHKAAPHYADWERQHPVDLSAWKAAGADGLIGLSIPEQYGADLHPRRPHHRRPGRTGLDPRKRC